MRDRVSLFNRVRTLLHTSITQSVWLVAVTLTAPLLAAGGGRAAAHPADLTVRVNITFDRSLSSKALQVAAKKEASAIWADYGVALEWTETGAPPDLSLDAIAERRHEHVNHDRVLVLGRTTIGSGSETPEPIHISLDAMDALFDQQPAGDVTLHNYSLAIALGRVLAHELGHVLLGSPGYHDPVGMMRAKIPVGDLIRLERSQFGLTPQSVARLRARIASLAEARSPDSCVNSTPSNW
jgi:hypothetical protein